MQHAEEFRHKFEVPINRQQRSTQKTLIVEEVKEFLEAEQTMINGFTRNESECLKELADVVYVCFQFASVMDWDLDEALMRRVHQSNLSKLDDEGKPVLRADGKVMKGPNYQPPDLSDLVCLQATMLQRTGRVLQGALAPDQRSLRKKHLHRRLTARVRPGWTTVYVCCGR